MGFTGAFEGSNRTCLPYNNNNEQTIQEELRLRGQSRHPGRLGSRQDEHPAAVHGGRVPAQPPRHDRRRLQKQVAGGRRPHAPVPAVGHCRPGAVQDHRADLLQERRRHHPRTLSIRLRCTRWATGKASAASPAGFPRSTRTTRRTYPGFWSATSVT